MTHVLVSRHARARSSGPDGIPNFVCAVRGDSMYWRPRSGYRLEVRCNGVVMRYVIEADRVAGEVLTKKMIRNDDGTDTEVPGVTILHQGRVMFRVMPVEVTS